MRKLISTASLIALMTIPAMAEDAAPKTQAMPAEQGQAAEKMATATDAGRLSASDLLNKSVKNASDEVVGDINDLVIDTDGSVAAVIVGVGGFLGLGEKDIAMPFDQLKFARDADGALIVRADVTKESLEAAPEWKKPADRT